MRSYTLKENPIFPAVSVIFWYTLRSCYFYIKIRNRILPFYKGWVKRFAKVKVTIKELLALLNVLKYPFLEKRYSGPGSKIF